MAAIMILFILLCTALYSTGQWQRELQPQSENGFNDLLSAIRPVTLQASRNNNKVILAIKYKPSVTTVSFWSMDVTGEPELTFALGELSNDGGMQVSSIEINEDIEVTEVKFHISSNIGEVVLELNHDAFKDQTDEIEIPDIGVRPLVPSVYEPMAHEAACTEQYIYVKFERDDNDIDLNYDIDVEFTFVDSYPGEEYLNRESEYSYNHFLKKNIDFYWMEIELKPDYIRNGSEVKAKYEKSGIFEDEVNNYVKSISKNVYSVIRPPIPLEYLLFHDELGMFRGTKQTIDIPDKSTVWALSCAAFGVPKPKIQISDPNGDIMSVKEVTLGYRMTTHVITPLANFAYDKIAGDYKCIARSGQAIIVQTVTLKTSSTQ